MSTTIYLTNLDSDVAGCKLALVNERNPSPPASVATAVTNTTASGADIPMTLTAGGTTAKWITKPLAVAVTLATKPLFNIWGLESNAAANAGFSMRIAQYTGGAEGASLLTSDYGTEVNVTPAADNVWLGAAVSSTAFAIGDRIVINPYIDNVGTMGASQTVTMTYDGATANVSGDTWVLFQEDVRVNELQLGSGSVPPIRGKSVSWAYDLSQAMQQAVDQGFISANATVQSAIDDATALMNIL